MKRLKDILLESLSDTEEFTEISPEIIGDIKDIVFSKKNDYMKIEFSTTYGKDLSIVVKHSDFINWINKNAGKYKKMFRDFLSDFVAKSKETSELSEIVDDNGDIMANDDKPNNATNTMVGSSVFDLEKIYRTSIPKNRRFYSGDLGIGVVTW